MKINSQIQCFSKGLETPVKSGTTIIMVPAHFSTLNLNLGQLPCVSLLKPVLSFISVLADDVFLKEKKDESGSGQRSIFSAKVE